MVETEVHEGGGGWEGAETQAGGKTEALRGLVPCISASLLLAFPPWGLSVLVPQGVVNV